MQCRAFYVVFADAWAMTLQRRLVSQGVSQHVLQRFHTSNNISAVILSNLLCRWSCSLLTVERDDGPVVRLFCALSLNERPEVRGGRGSGWTKPPGMPLHQTEEGLTAVEISGSSVEFVMTDGNGLWDKPDLRHGSNYVIKRPGSYCLESGRLRAM